MLFVPTVSVFRRVLAAMALSVLVTVTAIAQTTPAWADGTSWSPASAAAQQQWRSVAYGNGVWVAAHIPALRGVVSIRVDVYPAPY